MSWFHLPDITRRAARSMCFMYGAFDVFDVRVSAQTSIESRAAASAGLLSAVSVSPGAEQAGQGAQHPAHGRQEGPLERAPLPSHSGRVLPAEPGRRQVRLRIRVQRV